MQSQFARTEMLLGKDAVDALAAAHVAVFGVGGVGGFAAEALARSGVGAFDLIDSDTVSLTNLNRQIIALHSTLGRYKADVMRERILDINPRAHVTAHRTFFLPDTKSGFDFSRYSYAVDAVDTVAAKILIIKEAKAAGIPVISSMGAGNKLDPARFEVADISETSVCPLARVMRQALRRQGIRNVKVVYSREPPLHPAPDADEGAVPGSAAFVPSVAGLIIAAEVVKELTAHKKPR